MVLGFYRPQKNKSLEMLILREAENLSTWCLLTSNFTSHARARTHTNFIHFPTPYSHTNGCTHTQIPSTDSINISTLWTYVLAFTDLKKTYSENQALKVAYFFGTFLCCPKLHNWFRKVYIKLWPRTHLKMTNF